MNNYFGGVIGFGLNGGAYISEIIRGVLYSVEQGQKEEATALRHVLLPQSISVALPPLVNLFFSHLKDSSLISVLAITKLNQVSRLTYMRTFRAFELYMPVGALYFGLIYIVSLMSRYLERQFQITGRYGE